MSLTRRSSGKKRNSGTQNKRKEAPKPARHPIAFLNNTPGRRSVRVDCRVCCFLPSGRRPVNNLDSHNYRMFYSKSGRSGRNARSSRPPRRSAPASDTRALPTRTVTAHRTSPYRGFTAPRLTGGPFFVPPIRTVQRSCAFPPRHAERGRVGTSYYYPIKRFIRFARIICVRRDGRRRAVARQGRQRSMTQIGPRRIKWFYWIIVSILLQGQDCTR